MFGNGYNTYPGLTNIGAKKGILSGLSGKWDWSTILGNTQKTLGIINQAIPIMYQIKPIITNARTIFRIMGAIKDDDIESPPKTISKTGTTSSKKTTPTTYINYANSSDEPQFFL